jgi:N6-adenosine-specific RNA methylase IME4
MNAISLTAPADLAHLSVSELVRIGCDAIEKAGSFDELRAIAAKADALQAFQRAIGAATDALNAAAEIRIRAQRRMGQELADAGLAGGDRSKIPQGDFAQTKPRLADIGISANQSSRYQALAAIPVDTFDTVVEAHKQAGEPISAASVARTANAIEELPSDAREELIARGEAEILRCAAEIRVKKSAERRAENELLRQANPPVVVDGKYDVIVIDPPWPMKKIGRDVAPNQTEDLDYPTEGLEKIAARPVADWAADDCHLFCWTTHKFLPMTFGLLEGWGFRYVYTVTWFKNGGFKPFNLPMYNTEFCVYGRKGTPKFVDETAFYTGFETSGVEGSAGFPVEGFKADRREHSRKPDQFYDVIKRVTDGRRIDVFSREKREGFDGWGNETDKFNAAPE